METLQHLFQQTIEEFISPGQCKTNQASKDEKKWIRYLLDDSSILHIIDLVITELSSCICVYLMPISMENMG